MDKENEIVTNSARENLNNSHTQHAGLEFTLGYDLTETLALAAVYNFAEHTYENSQNERVLEDENQPISAPIIGLSLMAVCVAASWSLTLIS